MGDARATRNRLVVALLLGAIALLAITFHVSVAAGPPYEPKRETGWLFDGLRAHLVLRSLETALAQHRDDIDLSEEQLTQLRAISSEYEKSWIHAEAEARMAEREVRVLSNNEKAELTDIESALIRLATALASIHTQSIKALRAVQSIVRPEQREKWERLLNLKRLESRQGSA